MAMVWNKYSEDIADAFLQGDSNILVSAVPGSGKTTNIQRLWDMAPDESKLYLVFNKHNQIEAKGKLGLADDDKRNAVLTLNSLGARAIYNTVGKVVLDERKVGGIIRDMVTPRWRKVKMPFEQIRANEAALARAVMLAKGIDTQGALKVDTYYDMVDMYDLPSYDGMYTDVVKVLQKSDDMVRVIDFADQLRFPALFDYSMPEYDRVLGDEVQDFNPIQAVLIGKLQAKQYTLVGDPRQSIYGFRGAMNDSMEYLAKQFNCTKLPLSITYRCARAIVKEAYAIYPEIEAWEQSPSGRVERGIAVDCEKITSDYFTDSDTLVVCRTNAPLICMAYGLLKQGIPCHVRGRDIGQGLVVLIRKQGVQTVGQLVYAMQQWHEQETYKAAVREDERKVKSIQDKYDSVMLFANKSKPGDSVNDVIASVDAMFSQGRGLCLSTVHKAKGLEAKKCYMLQAGLHDMYEGYAKLDWQKVQEKNCKYVAVTRAKEELVYM